MTYAKSSDHVYLVMVLSESGVPRLAHNKYTH